MYRELTKLEESIVKFASDTDMLAELCVLADYDMDMGRVAEHWIPRFEVLSLATHLIEGNKDITQGTSAP